MIVNTARGAVMDEEALVQALESGHVACAGLDVYELEPSVHPGLLANPHVILLPHMGTWTLEVRRSGLRTLIISYEVSQMKRLRMQCSGGSVLEGRVSGGSRTFAPMHWCGDTTGPAA